MQRINLNIYNNDIFLIWDNRQRCQVRYDDTAAVFDMFMLLVITYSKYSKVASEPSTREFYNIAVFMKRIGL
uniref:Uncharacterized protein n=1 Tax=Ascaris lumbricoides TaxID=6252 RepID=A0A0M3IMX1_ASCLU